MKQLVLPFLLTFIAPALAAADGQSSPSPEVARLLRRPADPADAESQARQLIALMTPEERFDLVSGGNSFGISACPRLGIPPVNFADASSGIRIMKDTPSGEYKQTTAFPATILLASTWSPELAAEYAGAIGEEMRAGNIHVLLGPGANIYRVSLNGRNFEYLGEDPFLSSQLVGSYIRGLQAQGVAGTVKHFLCNETELYRRNSNSIVGERALQEIYLPPFRAAIDNGVWAVMTSYNQFNGEWAGQSATVINGILRGQLGFKWLCMTDWNSVWHGKEIAASGQDLEKPAGSALKRDRDALLGSPEVDRMAASILKTCIAAGFFEPGFHQPALMANWSAREAVARKVNDRGIVLLKNDGILPLDPASPANGDILVLGTNAKRAELSGRGSGHVKGFNTKTYAAAVQAAFPGDVVVESWPSDAQIRAAKLILFFPGYPLVGAPAESEGNDRPFWTPDDKLIERCTRLNPRTVVCVTAGAGIEMDWAPQAAAILQVYYGGQTAPDALMDILAGKTNPSGKLPFTIEKHFADSPASGYDRRPFKTSSTWPAEQFNQGPALHGILYSKDKKSVSVYDNAYDEGVFVGYRWYDAKAIEPRFPFGHGLSYTTFEYRNLSIGRPAGGRVRVAFTLTNTGRRAGEEVAQVYVGDVRCSVPRPPRELKAFQRAALAPGESRRIEIELDTAALGFWDETTHGWKVEPGEFEVFVGGSSRDLPLRGKFEL
ncbi:MAG TPA: glycoside hydrolase family 3 C-terminal domain-containing protein [Opitutaceae bacterium]